MENICMYTDLYSMIIYLFKSTHNHCPLHTCLLPPLSPPQYAPHIQPGNEDLVHHMEVFHCELPPHQEVPLYQVCMCGRCFRSRMCYKCSRCRNVTGFPGVTSVAGVAGVAGVKHFVILTLLFYINSERWCIMRGLCPPPIFFRVPVDPRSAPQPSMPVRESWQPGPWGPQHSHTRRYARNCKEQVCIRDRHNDVNK